MNWKRLNSLTKYPPIPTYHALVDGHTDPQALSQVDFGTEPVGVTEKIDGTNGRIILFYGDWRRADWAIGSREELLCAEGDRIPNPALFIAETLAPLAERARELFRSGIDHSGVMVLYAEVYGSGIGGAAAQYAPPGVRGARLFDVGIMPSAMLEKTPAEIAKWREDGGQRFLSHGALESYVEEFNDAPEVKLETVPWIGARGGTQLPRTVAGVKDWLLATANTTIAPLGAGGLGLAEGVVVRTEDRAKIAKIRFDDYLSREERFARKRRDGLRELTRMTEEAGGYDKERANPPESLRMQNDFGVKE